MPRLDKTGPAGTGPMTGRQAGDCEGARPSGRGFAQGRGGFGRGRAFCRRAGFGRGFGFRRMAFAPACAEPVWEPYAEPTKEEQRVMLEEEAKAIEQEQKALKEEMEYVHKKLKDLKK